ncbi:MAG TPA: DnaA/Hda family protein [Vineibacter sp.]|nr:DnaA/Hda family protein [Vineibacter sp.]
MAQQLPLDLAGPPAYGRADFLAAEANRAALAWIDRWPDWPGPATVLVGPPGSGKTHLLHLWAARSEALRLTGAALDRTDREAIFDALAGTRHLALDDAEAVAGRPDAERNLFHAYNWLRERGGGLLLAARTAPARWTIGLPDLASRLRAAAVPQIEPPDDALLGAVLVKLFHDQQLKISEDVIRYLVDRMERSLSAARTIVARIDQRTLADKRAVTVRLLREMAGELGLREV